MNDRAKVTVEFEDGSVVNLVLRSCSVDLKQDIKLDDEGNYTLGSKTAIIHGFAEKGDEKCLLR